MKQQPAWFGYVYLLKCGELYKIGHSVKPRKRFGQLRTGSPFPIEVVHMLKTAHYRAIEKQLHHRFRRKRTLGEWFQLDAEDLAYITSLNKYGQTPEEEKEREESDARYFAGQRALEQAAHDQMLAILHSGAASGYGLGICFEPSL